MVVIGGLVPDAGAFIYYGVLRMGCVEIGEVERSGTHVVYYVRLKRGKYYLIRYVGPVVYSRPLQRSAHGFNNPS